MGFGDGRRGGVDSEIGGWIVGSSLIPVHRQVLQLVPDTTVDITMDFFPFVSVSSLFSKSNP